MAERTKRRRTAPPSDIFTMRLNPLIVKRLAAIAEREHTSMSAVARKFIIKGLGGDLRAELEAEEKTLAALAASPKETADVELFG